MYRILPATTTTGDVFLVFSAIWPAMHNPDATDTPRHLGVWIITTIRTRSFPVREGVVLRSITSRISTPNSRSYARFRGYKSTFGVLSTFSASWDRIQETSTFPSHNSPEVFRGSYSGELSVFLSHVHDRTLRCDATGAISGHVEDVPDHSESTYYDILGAIKDHMLSGFASDKVMKKNCNIMEMVKYIIFTH